MSDEPTEDELNRLLHAATGSRELSEDESRELRDALTKVVPAVRAAMRKQTAAMEEAARDGKLWEFLDQLRVKCAKCDKSPVTNVIIEVRSPCDVIRFGLCEEHAREYHDKRPPGTPRP
jgi:hypothetical protein